MFSPDVQLRKTQYDLEEAVQRIRATSYPDAEDFAARNVLKPPSKQEGLGHRRDDPRDGA